MNINGFTMKAINLKKYKNINIQLKLNMFYNNVNGIDLLHKKLSYSLIDILGSADTYILKKYNK